jgi:hypothetical protein
MANLTTAPAYDPIYQLEVADDVIGGAGGISNLQAQALGDRDDYIKQQITYLLLDKRDSATMAGVSFPSAVTLPVSPGTTFIAGGNYGTAILPPIASFPDNSVIAIQSPAVGTFIQGNGSETIDETLSIGVNQNTQTIWGDEVAVLKKFPGATSWILLHRLGSPYPGTVSYFVDGKQPEGWISCNGSTVSATQYPRLCAVVSGGSSFVLPNMGATTFGAQVMRWFIHA